KVLIAVRTRLTAGEDARILNINKAKNIDAYLKVVQAFALCQAGNKESTAQARRLTEEAIALDPGSAAGYAALVLVMMNETSSGVYPKPQEALEEALELGKKTVELDPTCSTGRALLTGVYLMLRRTDKALAEAEKLLSMAPNSSSAYFCLGAVLFQLARNQEVIPVLEKSLRLSPVPVNSSILLLQGYAYSNLGRLEEAVTAFRKGARHYPNHLQYHLGLAQAYFRLNRQKEAHSEMEEVLRIDPRFSLDRALKTIYFQSQKGKEEAGETLRNLGLK
ncbi:MAG: hypothetical protein C0407_18170, partial [Desulfobacca sp.]|nr:hypothetical protein [Desulfobacca sp.]